MNNLRVLIVDDEPLVCRGVAKMVSAWPQTGRAETAGDGYEALDVLRRRQTDIVITDIRMPEMTGLELIKQARENNLCDYFVVLSSYADFQYAQQSLDLGAVAYLLNPVDKAQLYGALDKAADTIEANRQTNLYKESLSELLYRNTDAASSEEITPSLITDISGREIKESGLSKNIRSVLRYTMAHYLEPGLTLEDAAREGGMHPNYLSTTFSKEMGMSWIRCLAALRVMHAQKLLISQPQMPVQTVAGLCGFDTPNHFYRMFKRHVKMTPGEYREKQRRQ